MRCCSRRRGAHVIAADVNGQGCEDAVADIVRAGGSAEAHAVDLGDRAALDAFLAKVETAHEVIDVLYNHVGITGPTRLDFDAAAWDECVRVNVWVPTAVTQRLVPQLRRSGSCLSSHPGCGRWARRSAYRS